MTNISIDSNSFLSTISISCQFPSSLLSHSYYSYRDLYHSFIYNHYWEYSSYTPISSWNNIVTSSSITFEIGDNRDKLINYFNWLAVIYFIIEEWFQECLLILKSKEIVYETLLDIPIILWKKWDIIDGVMIMIKRYITKWNHEWIKGCVWVIIDEFKDIIIA